MIINDEIGIICKEVVTAYFKKVFQHLLGGNIKIQSGLLVSSS
jgi:hypothetical protein